MSKALKKIGAELILI